MNKPNEPNFETEVELVNVPSDTAGDDPLTLFESEGETSGPQSETSGAYDSAFVSGALPLQNPTRERGPLPLDRLLQRLGHVEWPESVAIVEALCGVLTSRESQRVPEMSRVAITFEGTVIVGTAASKEAAGPVLARVLHALAAGGSVPAALRLFVTKWASASESHSIQEFARELAYFARPDGRQLIQAVYERAMASRSVQAMPVTKAPAETFKETPRAHPRLRQETHSRTPYVAAAVIVALGIVATAVFAWRGAPALSTSGSVDMSAPGTTGDVPAAENTSSVQGARARGAGTGSRPSAQGTTGARSSQAGAPEPEGNRVGGLGTASPVSSALRASLAAPNAASPRALPAPAPDPTRPVPLEPTRVPARDDGGGPVYSRSDPDVTPPVFLHPQLPAQILSGLQPYEHDRADCV
jgi:hypothetical protein